MQASIAAIEYYLPEDTLTTEDLAKEFPEWSVDKIDGKTGIRTRHIAGASECASDLAVAAARKLFDTGVCGPESIDYILLCTQTPDYLLPTTACLIQDRLGIPMTAGAFDFNLGSSGYVYGLGMAQGLIATGQASRILFLTSDTYSKLLHPRDRSVRTIFGDAAAATLLAAEEAGAPRLGPFVYGTDGRGLVNLLVPAGGMRTPRGPETAVAVEDSAGNVRSQDNLYMSGGDIFTFTIQTVPRMVNALLQKAAIGIADVDLFVFHQANEYMLDYLRKRLKIPCEKFQISMDHCGNTVSCTIPIALKDADSAGKLKSGMNVMLVGFGVGYSWGATLMKWRDMPSHDGQ